VIFLVNFCILLVFYTFSLKKGHKVVKPYRIKAYDLALESRQA